jgi:uncharacterized protein YndB with AHSA1/START domain
MKSMVTQVFARWKLSRQRRKNLMPRSRQTVLAVACGSTIFGLGLVLAFAGPNPADAPKERTLIVQGEVDAPADEIWSAFQSPEGIVKAWGVARAKVDFRIGGEIRTAYSPETDLDSAQAIVNTILAYEPGRMLAIRPTAPEGAPDWLRAICESGFNVIRIEPIGAARSRVIVTDMGFKDGPLFDKAYEFFARGNQWTVDHMKTAFAKAVEPAVDDPLEPIRIEASIPKLPSEVFRLISTSEGWREFFGVSSKIELRPGGAFELHFAEGAPDGSRGSEGCTVLSYIPGELFSFTWSAPPSFPKVRQRQTWVVVTLEPDGAAATRVVLTQLGFAEEAAAAPDLAEDWRGVRKYFAAAWPKVLGALREAGN